MGKFLYLKSPIPDAELLNIILGRLYEINNLHKREDLARKKRDFGELLRLLIGEARQISGIGFDVDKQTYRVELRLKRTREELKNIRNQLKANLNNAKRQKVVDINLVRSIKKGIQIVDSLLRQIDDILREIRSLIEQKFAVEKVLRRKAA